MSDRYADGFLDGWAEAAATLRTRFTMTPRALPQPQTVPDSTPDPAEPADGQLNPFTSDCGFFCHCAGPRPDVWQPGSVTR